MTIRIDYENVYRQAARLQQLADEHTAAAAALDGQRATLAAAWSDPAGATYVDAALRLAADMRATAAQLRGLGAEIRNAAAKFEAQEQANAKAAGGLVN